MNAKYVELLQRLDAFQLDSPEASLPFSARLARENKWSLAHAQRVIAEYKRFAFLAVAAGHPVSPSEAVDQAWHLHLAYSESYWREFCPHVLGKPLHHQPTRGGAAERDKFEDWYARTLASYELFFNAPPPADIWPAPAAHRNASHDFIRIDRQRYWLLPKPRFQLSRKFLLWLALGATPVACTGAMLASGANVLDWRGRDFLGFYCLLFAACFAVALWERHKLRVPVARFPLDLPRLDGYSIAFLNGGKWLAVNTVIGNLIRRKALRLSPEGKRLFSLEPVPAFDHEAEEKVYLTALSPSGAELEDVRLAAKPAITEIAEDLKTRGLIMHDAAARRAIFIPLVISLAAVGLGVLKIIVGVSRGKPVGLLAALCVMSGFLSLFAFGRRPARSRQGDAVLDRLKETHRGPEHLGREMSTMSSADFTTAIGLFGLGALAGTDLADIHRSLRPPPGEVGTGGSSCGGGCGSSCGGGCGGGCGGCGGD